MSTLDTFIANLAHVVRNRETIDLGGGAFRSHELVEILEALKLGQQVAINAQALVAALDKELPQSQKHCAAGERANLRSVLSAYEEAVA